MIRILIHVGHIFLWFEPQSCGTYFLIHRTFFHSMFWYLIRSFGCAYVYIMYLCLFKKYAGPCKLNFLPFPIVYCMYMMQTGTSLILYCKIKNILDFVTCKEKYYILWGMEDGLSIYIHIKGIFFLSPNSIRIYVHIYTHM